MTVKQWVNKNKLKNGVSQSYLNWNVDRYSYLDLIELYVNHLHSMAEHTFMATWNYCQFKRARTNIKPGELLLVNDFAQNYLCLLQNEPQGMHWEHKQVTLHPTVAYYTCPNDHCAMTVIHEFMHMSEDLKHDAHIVKRFVNESVKVVKSWKIEIRKIIQFSDQAPSQYKNKSAFKYLTQMYLPTMLNFLVSDMAKGHVMHVLARSNKKLIDLSDLKLL